MTFFFSRFVLSGSLGFPAVFIRHGVFARTDSDNPEVAKQDLLSRRPHTHPARRRIARDQSGDVVWHRSPAVVVGRRVLVPLCRAALLCRITCARTTRIARGNKGSRGPRYSRLGHDGRPSQREESGTFFTHGGLLR